MAVLNQPAAQAAGAAPTVAQPLRTGVRSITMRQAVQATIIVLLLALGFWMVGRFRYVVLAVLMAAILHVGMRPAVEALYTRGVRRQLGVFIVYGLLLLAVVGFVLVLAPMLAGQIGSFSAQLPDYYRLARNWLLTSSLDLLPRLARLLPPAWDMSSLQAIVVQAVGGVPGTAASPWALLGRAGEVFFFLIAILAMGFYWTMDRDRIVYNFVLRLPMARRDPTRNLIAELEGTIGAFMRGQLILCAAVGLLSLVAYFLIGLPYALALAAMAFVFEAVPMVGPILAAIPAVLVAAAAGPDKVLWVLIATVVIQSAENNLLVPRIMDRTVGVNAIVTILAITAFSLLFGLLGALLAIPLAAMLQILIDRYIFSREFNTDESDLLEPVPGAETAPGANRTRLDLLRLQAAELAQDVRKQLRNAESDAPPEVALLDDLIEQTAVELAALLTAVEAPAAPQAGVRA